ncbi:hypothetical protein [Oceaniglobus ichthyenteri]|uniref:hypothetical protein n=1 Tax=Oceaniglobus ichthyenteri TaxID=2136177 RepID=UPI000D37DAF7|nr:hypothetical protein [Oceaniglobus ichthyenteri]
MPDIAKFYIKNCLIGFFWAGLFVAALLWFNVANLWALVENSDVGILATLLLFFFNGIVFAGAQCGVAIMLMSEKDDQDPTGGHGAAEPALVPIRIR